MKSEISSLKFGPGAAAMLAAGIGSFSVGLFTVLAEISPAIKTFLTWVPQVGALSGKTGMAMILFLVTWLVLGTALKNSKITYSTATSLTLALVALGVLLTFPPIFRAFGG